MLSIFGGLLLLAVGLGIWWLETRFGANAAAMVFGGLGVVLIFLLGLLTAHKIQSRTVDQFVDATEIMANGDAMRSRAVVEGLRVERVNAQAQGRHEQMLLGAYQRGIQTGQTAQRQLIATEQQQAALQPQWETVDEEWR
jgi:Na+-transporting methylmalonyl-CoA/oxaloacetate decarboxylase gamma subunit